MATELKNITLVEVSIPSPSRLTLSLDMTVISRQSSTSTIPPPARIARPPPAGPRGAGAGGVPEESVLVSVFQGQDAVVLAVVLALALAAFPEHSRMMDTSIKAVVKRLVASTYGTNDQDAKAAAIFPESRHGFTTRDELLRKEAYVRE